MSGISGQMSVDRRRVRRRRMYISIFVVEAITWRSWCTLNTLSNEHIDKWTLSATYNIPWTLGRNSTILYLDSPSPTVSLFDHKYRLSSTSDITNWSSLCRVSREICLGWNIRSGGLLDSAQRVICHNIWDDSIVCSLWWVTRSSVLPRFSDEDFRPQAPTFGLIQEIPKFQCCQ